MHSDLPSFGKVSPDGELSALQRISMVWLPSVHTVVNNFKRFLIEKFYGVSKVILQVYTNEIAWRMNCLHLVIQLPKRFSKFAVDHVPLPTKLMQVHRHLKFCSISYWSNRKSRPIQATSFDFARILVAVFTWSSHSDSIWSTRSFAAPDWIIGSGPTYKCMKTMKTLFPIKTGKEYSPFQSFISYGTPARNSNREMFLCSVRKHADSLKPFV